MRIPLRVFGSIGSLGFDQSFLELYSLQSY